MTQLSIPPGPESAPPDRCPCCEAHRRQLEEINTGSFRAAAQNQTRLGVQIQAQDTHAHPQQTDSEANKVAASTAPINFERNDHEKTRMSTTSTWQNEVYEVLESLVDVTAAMVDVAQMLADAIPSTGSKFELGLERESGLGLEHERKFQAQSKVQDQVDKTQLGLKPDAEDALDETIKRFDTLIRQRRELVCREAEASETNTPPLKVDSDLELGCNKKEAMESSTQQTCKADLQSDLSQSLMSLGAFTLSVLLYSTVGSLLLWIFQ